METSSRRKRETSDTKEKRKGRRWKGLVPPDGAPGPKESPKDKGRRRDCRRRGEKSDRDEDRDCDDEPDRDEDRDCDRSFPVWITLAAISGVCAGVGVFTYCCCCCWKAARGKLPGNLTEPKEDAGSTDASLYTISTMRTEEEEPSDPPPPYAFDPPPPPYPIV
ncbi:unnamed protein product [Darwinula stevensoni]|uniref:Uncharacterized protein n=1 Tax=Darwinula stevensoni TaxID=69355 RepID=A0A7R9A973_9CRUS|nr:unnamed protein product [Darwinula stevensoni]CAG0897155.1 unnamed protein product [Darwinula stevensoni]